MRTSAAIADFDVPQLSSRIPSLDGLRAISIILVLIGHWAMSNNAPAFLDPLHHLGNFGVRCFFIISGFLITTLLMKESAKNGALSLKGFYVRRAIRIFPASLTFIAIIALFAHFGLLKLKPYDLIHALTYTMNYHYSRSWWFDHLWSLSVEEQFYLLWPGVLVLLGFRRGFRVAYGVLLVVPIIRAIMWFWLDSTDTAMTKQFQANADALATGCLLAANYNWLGACRQFQRFQASLLFWPLALGLVAFGNMMFVIAPASFYIIGQTIANIGTVLSIDWCIRHSQSAIANVLNTPILTFVGVLSYSLYLWQNVFLNTDWGGWPATFPHNMLFAFGAAAASYYLIEKPFLALKSGSTPKTSAKAGDLAKAAAISAR